MKTKWFITAKAKSKGFFTGFNNCYHSTCKNNTIHQLAGASFTKETALANPQFDTQEEGVKWLNFTKDKISDSIKKQNDIISEIEEIKRKWITSTHTEKLILIRSSDLFYHIKGKGWRETDVEYKNRIDSFNIDELYTSPRGNITRYTAQLKYLEEHLFVTEHDMEIKFMDRERHEINWEIRKETDINHSYCNCCGGAVPSIPQLVLKNRGRYADHVRVCAICMMKLAEEAKIQAGKIPDDILEQYNTDRFLKYLG